MSIREIEDVQNLMFEFEKERSISSERLYLDRCPSFVNTKKPHDVGNQSNDHFDDLEASRERRS
jgi:hypothetical protein